MQSVRELLAKTRVVAFYPGLVSMAGSPAGAVFLSQLLYWFAPPKGESKLRIKREGKLWLAKSQSEWATECGLSRQNIRTTEKVLVRQGILEVRVWKYAGAPTRHYHLNLKAFRCGWINQIHLVDSSKSIDLVDSTKSITEITTETTTETKVFTDANASETATSTDMGSKTAKEILVGIKKKIDSDPEKPTKVTAKSLSHYWLTLVPKVVDIGLQRPHTMKELGVLAQYAKLAGVHAVPAMEWAIKHWDMFRYRAKEELGFEVPTKPSIYSLLKAMVVAVEGYQKVEVVSLAPKMQPIALKEDVDQPATEADVVAMLNEVHKP